MTLNYKFLSLSCLYLLSKRERGRAKILRHNERTIMASKDEENKTTTTQWGIKPNSPSFQFSKRI